MHEVTPSIIENTMPELYEICYNNLVYFTPVTLDNKNHYKLVNSICNTIVVLHLIDIKYCISGSIVYAKMWRYTCIQIYKSLGHNLAPFSYLGINDSFHDWQLLVTTAVETQVLVCGVQISAYSIEH